MLASRSSVDEIAGFHETLNSLIEMSWAVPGLVVAVVLGLLSLKFLSSLPAATAVYFRAIGGKLATEPFLYNDELDTLTYNLWAPVEEGMEMGGYFQRDDKELEIAVMNPADND